MTTLAGIVTHVGPDGVTVLAGGVDANRTIGPMESVVSGLTEGSRVLVGTRDDVVGTWVVLGELAALPTTGAGTAPRSSTMGVRWKVRRLRSATFTARWAVAQPSSHPVSDTFSVRYAVKRRISATLDVRFRVLGNALNLGPDLRTYMRLAGGQKVLLAPGNYHAGKLPALLGSAYEHPRNAALPFNGKLRIGAQIPGTVKVYVDATGGGRFSFTDPDKGGALGWGWDDYYTGAGYGELGISFEDLDFVNGRSVFTGTSGVDFVNVTWTNPPALWKQNFDTVCQLMGVPVVAQIPNNDTYRNVFDSDRWKGNGTPGGLRLQGMGVFNPWTNQAVPHPGEPCRRIRLVNCDGHDVYDDPLYWGGSRNCKSRGLRHWNVGEVVYYGEGPRAWIHPDVGGQMVGAEDDIDIEASELHGHIQWAAEQPGNITRLRAIKTRQLNYAINSIMAFQFRNVSGVLDEFQWGADNVNNDGDYAYAATHPWYPMPDASDYFPISLVYPAQDNGVHLKYLTKADLTAMGYTMGGNQGRALANPLQAINDPANYANQWRTAHPTNTDAGIQAAIASVGGWAWAPS